MPLENDGCVNVGVLSGVASFFSNFFSNILAPIPIPIAAMSVNISAPP